MRCTTMLSTYVVLQALRAGAHLGGPRGVRSSPSVANFQNFLENLFKKCVKRADLRCELSKFPQESSLSNCLDPLLGTRGGRERGANFKIVRCIYYYNKKLRTRALIHFKQCCTPYCWICACIISICSIRAVLSCPGLRRLEGPKKYYCISATVSFNTQIKIKEKKKKNILKK